MSNSPAVGVTSQSQTAVRHALAADVVWDVATPQDVVAALYAKCRTWRWTVIRLEELTGQTFDRALLNRVARGKQAAPNSLRAALGFTVLIPAPACACGEVHVRRGRCPNAPKPQPPAWVTAAADLLAARERLTPPAVRVYGRGGKAVTW